MSNYRELFLYNYYHIFNRGFNQQKLFFNSDDYERFYFYLQRYLDLYPTIEIIAHCILPNHFHFLLVEQEIDPETGLFKETGLEDQVTTNISDFMRRLQVSYSMYFNTKYGDKVKPGLKLPVFEGRFKAKEILDEFYLQQLGLYIECNALKHGLVEQVEDWPYSSWSQQNQVFSKSEDQLTFFEDFEY